MRRFYESNKMPQKVQLLDLSPIVTDKSSHTPDHVYLSRVLMIAYLYTHLLLIGNPDMFLLYV